MWNSTEKTSFTDAKNSMDDKCELYESSRTDSGFLSGANLTSEQLYSEEIRSNPDSGVIEEEKEDSYMKSDSGVICLSENFSNLSLNLKNPSLNDLNSTKSRTNEEVNKCQTNVEQKEQSWMLYYRQDEDGDT